jgi:hypothetical protein
MAVKRVAKTAPTMIRRLEWQPVKFCKISVSIENPSTLSGRAFWSVQSDPGPPLRRHVPAESCDDYSRIWEISPNYPNHGFGVFQHAVSGFHVFPQPA